MASTTAITKLSMARRALIEAKTLVEVRSVADIAAAIRAYAKASGESLEIQNSAAHLRISAERKAGELLASMEKHTGDPRSHDVTRLDDIGITKMQSSRWQLAAKLPHDDYEAIYAQCNTSGKEFTQSAILRAARIHVFGEPEHEPHCESDGDGNANLLDMISMARSSIAELATAFGERYKTILISVLRDELEVLERAEDAVC